MVPVFNRATKLSVPVENEKDKRVKVILEGVEPDRPESIGDFTVTAGHWPEKKDEVMLDAQLAKDLGVKAGRRNHADDADQARLHCHVSGLIKMNDAAHLLQAGLVVAPVKPRAELVRELKARSTGCTCFSNPTPIAAG